MRETRETTATDLGSTKKAALLAPNQPQEPVLSRDATVRPILFSGAMVRAILDGTKTQTRRVLAFPPIIAAEGEAHQVEFDRMQSGYGDGSTRAVFDFDGEPNSFAVRCPYGQPGDRLWVRETWAPFFRRHDGDPAFGYRADLSATQSYVGVDRWRPSIHMPRAASRLTLEITAVRVERLQEITPTDAKAEGVKYSDTFAASPHPFTPAALVARYRQLWDSLNASRGYGWDANPWVWVVEFRAVGAA